MTKAELIDAIIECCQDAQEPSSPLSNADVMACLLHGQMRAHALSGDADARRLAEALRELMGLEVAA